ncbi:PrsW family intramembrane metalloprotease [Phycicoccus flavus]|uniref:PrsW family intramembrane metalloprotease n=1 Tax=Phycicoccus flavus TaxID=2502783 RepID=UPI000FEBBD61|nr:PrsW family glutamic-type intramembrane protease [Phycicoccus flavus]NHA67933.1 PrsW family intramembrane metalloprotease [Phycicoccus flavus]
MDTAEHDTAAAGGPTTSTGTGPERPVPTRAEVHGHPRPGQRRWPQGDPDGRAARTTRPWYRRLGWLWVLLVGTAAYVAELVVLVGTGNPNFFPSMLLLGATVVPLSVLTFAATSGTRVSTPTGWLVAVVVVGGVLGTLAAGLLEYDTLRRLVWGQYLMVGLIEEASKLVVPLVAMAVLWRRYPYAGVVVGVASGMGFAALETMGYGFTALLQARSLAAVDQTLLLRALLAPAGHVAWTGLTMAALWRVPRAAHRVRALLGAAGVFVVAVLLHAAWDGLNGLPAHVAVGVVSVVALLWTIHRVHHDEKLFA